MFATSRGYDDVAGQQFIPASQELHSGDPRSKVNSCTMVYRSVLRSHKAEHVVQPLPCRIQRCGGEARGKADGVGVLPPVRVLPWRGRWAGKI